MKLESIRKFLRLDERVATGGMPQAAHFAAMRAEGFDVVINLALPTSDNALANEGALVADQGMTYVHIPVKFDAPAPEDFRRFQQLMDALAGRKVFVHCAANMRVSAFMFLYHVLKDPSSRREAERQLRAIWEPDEIWRRFMDQQLAVHTKES